MAASRTCFKEPTIERLNKAVFGNGKDGVVQNIAAILEKTNNIERTMSDLQTGVSGLLKFQTEVTTEKNVIDKRRLNGWQMVSILGTIFLSAGAIIVAIIFKT
jgi:K+/H+ antiporter YhaU regulatory subunit KhtT